jgi:hypothetical protein|tara:strand:+ start:1010 stop:1336 length:327 start_codon:yes stop_codon:yes gene_type:complete
MTLLTKAVEEGIVSPTECEFPRENCPFYGFKIKNGLMMNSQGNQCGLKERYNPCMMKTSGEDPSWNACPYFDAKKLRDKLEELGGVLRVFPEELGEEGLPFRAWMRYF